MVSGTDCHYSSLIPPSF